MPPQRPLTPTRSRGTAGSSASTATASSRPRNRPKRATGAISVGADRVTPDWKMSIGASSTSRGQTFDLDEERARCRSRRERAASTGWWSRAPASTGRPADAARSGRPRSTTPSSTSKIAPAVEWNFFPYSMYTRRQLRVQYAIGGVVRRYYEETLFGKIEETRGGQEISDDLRTARAVGHARRQRRVLELFSRALDQPGRGRSRSQPPHRARTVALTRRVGVADSRSAVAAAARCDAGRSAVAASRS